jgi:hypothetical protein
MGARQTSIDCYNQIKAQGLLSKRRFEVYEKLLTIAPYTASELQKSMDYNNGGRDCMKRLSELRDLGTIYEKRERKCNVTGKIVIEWDLTDKLPIKPAKLITAKQIRVDTTIDALRLLYKNKLTASVVDWQNVADLIRKI